jgi:hypothetical protein
LLGIRFKLVTDHRALEFIFNKSNSRPPPRIERWVLRLQAFTYDVVYKPGILNIADRLSRLSVRVACVHDTPNVADGYAMMVAKSAVPVALTFSQVKKDSLDCPEMCIVRQALVDGNWNKCLPIYKAVSNELSQCDGIVMRGEKIVVPASLRTTVVDLAHEGHQGITKTKHRLRSKVWWPSMDKHAERVCRECFECQLVSAPAKPEPMSCTKMPDQPWQHVACDLLGPLPNGEYIFVMVDYYSRYFEVCFMRSVVTKKIIEVCQTIFCRWGLPISLRTDNGPQFGMEFQSFLKESGVFWLSTTPMWPAANGEVERQNRSLLKALKIAQVSGRDYKGELRKFLMAYRSTPHSVTGVSPAELITGRQMRTKLPCLDQAQTDFDGEIRDRQVLAKQKSKDQADIKRGAVENNDVSVGDAVLLRAEKSNKLSPTFQPEKHLIASRQGSEVVVSNQEGRQLRRNVTEVKRLVEPENDFQGDGEGLYGGDPPRPIRERRPPERYGNPLAH